MPEQDSKSDQGEESEAHDSNVQGKALVDSVTGGSEQVSADELIGDRALARRLSKIKANAEFDAKKPDGS